MTELRPQRPRFFAFVRRMLLVMVLLLVAGGAVIGLVSIEENISAAGVVLPRLEVRLHCRVDTVVLEVLVEDGDRVEAGQLLVALDDRAVRDQQARQQDAVTLKQADLLVAQRALERLRVAPLPENYRFAELEVERARARLASAEERLRPQQDLHEKRLASDQDLADAKAQVALATIDVKAAERRQQLVESGLAETILAEAEAGVERIRAELAVLQRQAQRTRELLTRYAITAPIQGDVVQVEKRPGERVTRGELVMVLTPDERRRVLFRVSERDIVKVQQGQEVRLYSPAFPYRQYGVTEGQVYMVENWAQTSAVGSFGEGARTYEVRAYVTVAPYVLRLGSSVQGDIMVGKKQIFRILLG
ncbi:MAG: HlyD family efflux transporter periplasmic adaptor subunit, partial [Planctomycetes bacterium]|nr:HlyD family efflux transporter periplasmic adaptor subunit [Planctomycetota bacterium]